MADAGAPAESGAAAPARSALGTWASGLKGATLIDGPLLVVGNEASDADSIVSAITYAYLRNECRREGAGHAIPMVACDRADVSLRRETTLLLELCGCIAEDVVFLDDDGAGSLLTRAASITLVDHNRATGPLAAHGGKVAEILDHHQDLGDHVAVAGDRRRIAFEDTKATAGSACTLVVEAFLEEAERGRALLSQDGGAVARALLGVILIDTVNLDPKAKKVTPRDVNAVRLLEGFCGPPPSDELYNRLNEAKNDPEFWKGLQTAQCLRYDYKRFEVKDSAGTSRSYGLSSVLCGLSSMAGKEAWFEEVEKRAGEVDIYGVMANHHAPGHVREVLLLSVGDGGALAARAAEFAMKYETPNLELEAMELSAPPGSHVFKQLNAGASRKQVAPCLAAFLSSV